MTTIRDPHAPARPSDVARRQSKALSALQSLVGLVLLSGGVAAQFGAATGISVAGAVLLAVGVWGLR
jgi:hypothetical protein